MTTACWAIYYHYISTDEDLQHDFCPDDSDSWCKYQQAQAAGDDPPHTNTLRFGGDAFNSGSQSLLTVMEELGVEAGPLCRAHLASRDRDMTRAAGYTVSDKVKQNRKTKRRAAFVKLTNSESWQQAEEAYPAFAIQAQLKRFMPFNVKTEIPKPFQAGSRGGTFGSGRDHL